MRRSRAETGASHMPKSKSRAPNPRCSIAEPSVSPRSTARSRTGITREPAERSPRIRLESRTSRTDSRNAGKLDNEMTSAVRRLRRGPRPPQRDSACCRSKIVLSAPKATMMAMNGADARKTAAIRPAHPSSDSGQPPKTTLYASRNMRNPAANAIETTRGEA